MSFLSKFLLFFATIIITFNAVHAQTSGSGCNVNGGGIFTTNLGTAPYYGNTSDMRTIYLNSTAKGNFVPRNVMGYKSDGNHYNYMCGYVNEFSSDYGPTQKELTERFPVVHCEVAAARNSPSDQAMHGNVYDFTYNNPKYCNIGAAPNNAPLDDYLSYLISISGILTFLTLRKNPVF